MIPIYKKILHAKISAKNVEQLTRYSKFNFDLVFITFWKIVFFDKIRNKNGKNMKINIYNGFLMLNSINVLKMLKY